MLAVLHQHRLRRDVVALSCVRRCERAGHARARRTPRAVRLVGGAADTLGGLTPKVITHFWAAMEVVLSAVFNQYHHTSYICNVYHA